MSFGDSSVASEPPSGPGLVPNVLYWASTAVLKPYCGFQIKNIQAPRLVRDDRRYRRAIMQILQSAKHYRNLSLRRKREMRARFFNMELRG